MTKKLNCHDVMLRLQSYLDDELNEERMMLIDQHLSDCRKCGLEEDVYRAVKSDLKALRPTDDSDALERLRDFSTGVSEVASSEQ